MNGFVLDDFRPLDKIRAVTSDGVTREGFVKNIDWHTENGAPPLTFVTTDGNTHLIQVAQVTHNHTRDYHNRPPNILVRTATRLESFWPIKFIYSVAIVTAFAICVGVVVKVMSTVIGLDIR